MQAVAAVLETRADRAIGRTDEKRGSRVGDKRLIARVLAGDGRAARDLYDAHVERVFRLCYRLAGDDHMAEEFTQETFVRAFERLDQFRGDSALGTWLWSIATSVTLNGLKKVKRLRTREVDLAAAATTHEDRGDRARRVEPDLRARLDAAIDDLPEGYRTVFIMHDVEGYTHEEIGAALGVQPGTSKSQLWRARARLREELSAFAGERV